MSSVAIEDLLNAGVHFGHQTKRWNPKMEEYIFEARNGVHIIDLRKTLRLLSAALEFVTDRTADGHAVLLVGTKKQCRELLKETAQRSKMQYVIDRWLGGTLTNFQTIRSSMRRLEELEALLGAPATEGRSKKELAALRREEQRLHRNLDGIRGMEKLPGLLVVIDILREQNAVREARRMGIPVVAVVDTNCDPTLVDYPIPGNDDGIRATKLIISLIEQAVAQGGARRAEKKSAREKKEAAKARPAERKKPEEAVAVEIEGEVSEAVKSDASPKPVGQKKGKVEGEDEDRSPKR